eukprot:2219637-Amphidinium_carterae.1
MALETRRLLGHHLDPAARSIVTYSRDALTSSHLELQKVFRAIRAGEFMPDASPGERIRLADL